jgi:DNA-binding YbaB/EbfC family protein
MLKGDMGNLMKQAQKMQAAQEKLAQVEATGSAGAGLVQVVINGRYDAKQVNIDGSLMSEDKEVLEDLLAAAINDAVRKVEKTRQEGMSDLTAGMVPTGFKLPF